MCKLFAVSGPLTKKQVKAAVDSANDSFAKCEKDGFGFIAAHGNKVARGRYLEPEKYWGFGETVPSFLSGPSSEENHLPEMAQCLIVHGRTSTNAVCLANVHPFRKHNVYLAHNGIVRYKGPGQAPKHSCDSGQFLHWLLEHKWEEAYDNWSGSGAMILYQVQDNLMTIAKDMASLFIAKRANSKGWVVATVAEQLTKICHRANIGLASKAINFPQGTILQMNGKGEIVCEHKWKGFAGWTGNIGEWEYGTQRAHGHVFGSAQVQQPEPKKETICLRETEKESFPDYDKGESLPSCNTEENASVHCATVEALSLLKTESDQNSLES